MIADTSEWIGLIDTTTFGVSARAAEAPAARRAVERRRARTAFCIKNSVLNVNVMLLHQLRYAITCAISGGNRLFGKMMLQTPTKTVQPLVSLAGVGVRRQGRWLVSGVEFSIAPGEIVTLIGPN